MADSPHMSFDVDDARFDELVIERSKQVAVVIDFCAPVRPVPHARADSRTVSSTPAAAKWCWRKSMSMKTRNSRPPFRLKASPR